MRKFLTILFLFCSLIVSGQVYHYIDPSGNDSGGGPWLTLHYACEQITTPGHVIFVNSGTYVETEQCVLAVGVSITGEGNSSIIHSHLTTDPLILLSSGTEGTNGNQSISWIRMEGGMTAECPVYTRARSNVKIHDCEFEDFFSEGPQFGGTTGGIGPPAIYATGNEFYNNTVINCADYSGANDRSGNGNGNIGIGGQSGMLVHDNWLEQTDRGIYATGYVIKFLNSGFNRGMKIYNNTIKKPRAEGNYPVGSWDFAIELWNSRGGIEIYNNDITGSIDLGGHTFLNNDAGGYGFAFKIYNNVIGQPTMQPYYEWGFHMERKHIGGIYVYNNIFKNITEIFDAWIGNGESVEDFYFYNNICYNINYNGNSFDVDPGYPGSATYHNINFVNNVYYQGTGAGMSAIRLTFSGATTEVTIRNNVMYGFTAYPIYAENSTITTMSVENNLYYDNGTNAAFYTGCTIVGKTEQNNIVDNPDFTSPVTNFHLLAGSPAISPAGIDISWLNYDFEGNPYENPPSIGVYKYGNTSTMPTVTTTAISNIDKTIATGGGNCTATGGAAITARGVCWSTVTNPTIAGYKTADGSGLGVFTSSLMGLIAGTTYYVRAYATNVNGTAYGSQVYFTTLPEVEPPTPPGVTVILKNSAGTQFLKNSAGDRILIKQ
jgi:hypothetical protein